MLVVPMRVRVRHSFVRVLVRVGCTASRMGVGVVSVVVAVFVRMRHRLMPVRMRVIAHGTILQRR